MSFRIITRWFAFVWSEYDKDAHTCCYWKGLIISWGLPKHEGMMRPHCFELIVDLVTWQDLYEECGSNITF